MRTFAGDTWDSKKLLEPMNDFVLLHFLEIKKLLHEGREFIEKGTPTGVYYGSIQIEGW